LLFLFVGICTGFAQTKTGTTIGEFLKIEPSAKYAGMGNAAASLGGEATALYFNPASLGRLENNDVQFTFNKWLADITFDYACAAIKVDKIGTFALSVTSLNSGEMDVRTVDQPLGTGEKYTVNDLALGLAYGLMLTDRVALGCQVTYINETIWHSSMSDIGFNFGVQYSVSQNGITLGASISNFGARSSFNGRDLDVNWTFDATKHGGNDQLPAELRTDEFSLPTIFRAGLSVPINFGKDYSFLIAADAVHPNDNAESVNIGGELTILKIFKIRTGYRNLFLSDSEGGFVIGGGVETSDYFSSLNIRFDYAYADYGRLDQAHRVTVGIGF
jgi:hypothetical protein